jgi:hypothetical protein
MRVITGIGWSRRSLSVAAMACTLCAVLLVTATPALSADA